MGRFSCAPARAGCQLRQASKVDALRIRGDPLLCFHHLISAHPCGEGLGIGACKGEGGRAASLPAPCPATAQDHGGGVTALAGGAHTGTVECCPRLISSSGADDIFDCSGSTDPEHACHYQPSCKPSHYQPGRLHCFGHMPQIS